MPQNMSMFSDAQRWAMMNPGAVNPFGDPNAVTTQASPVPAGKQWTPPPGHPDSPFAPSWESTGVPTDASGRPLTAKWISLGDDKTGLLKQPYQLTNQLDTSGINALRDVALRAPGTQSKWAQMAQSQQLNQLEGQQARQLSQARNNLAMQGGLRSGSAERLAQQNMLSGLQGGQGIRGQISMQDEQQRLAALNPLIAAQQQQAAYGTDIQQRNVQNALNEVMQGRINQGNQYNEAMRAWAARETAKATPSSGGKK